MLDSQRLLPGQRNQLSPNLGGAGPDDAKAGVDAFDHTACAVESGLADAVAGPVLVRDSAGAGLKFARLFAFFGKSGLLQRERWSALIAMQFRLKLSTVR